MRPEQRVDREKIPFFSLDTDVERHQKGLRKKRFDK